MDPVDTTVSELEQDALVEAFNVGIGSAAASFSQMVGQEVLLNLPKLSVVSRQDAIDRLSPESTTVCGVGQGFVSSFGNGRATVFFPESSSLELVHVLMGDEASEGEMAELEQEALTEVGNVILNACLAGLSNLVGEEFEVLMPSFQRCDSAGQIVTGDFQGEVVVLLEITFDLKERALNGHLAFMLGVASLRKLAAQLLNSMGMTG